MSTDDYHSTSGQAGGDGHALSSSVLVLNRSYVAIHIVSAKRAFSLLIKDGAEVVARYNGAYSSYNFDAWVQHSAGNDCESEQQPDFVHTPRFRILVPRVVRLLNYDKVPQRNVKFCRRNVITRDGSHCQYCGKKVPPSQLSIDHVVPKSLGGRSNWTNVVAACAECNAHKGRRLPRQAHMKLIKEPGVPKRHPLITVRALEPRYSLWREFLGESVGQYGK
jgi:5-methylcytosine-specific restriction endonuclease McrA